MAFPFAGTCNPMNTQTKMSPQGRWWWTAGLAIAVTLGCDDGSGADQPYQPPVVEEDELPPMEAQRAAVGVGQSSRRLSDGSAVEQAVGYQAAAYFNAKERIVFEVQLVQAAKLFEAVEGRKPDSHEEYMDKVVKANNILLPKLPENMRYRYLPEDGQLWVEPIEGRSAESVAGEAEE